MRSRVMQWVVFGTVAVFLATACSEDDEESNRSSGGNSPDKPEVTVKPEVRTKPEVTVEVTPGSFGTYYWRLFESELHSELGFEPTSVDNGMLWDGDSWFRMLGRLESARIVIYVWRTHGAPPPVRHEPYVRDFKEPPTDLNGVFLIARDDNGTMVRADLIGSDLSFNVKQRFRESVASVIQA